MWFLVVVLVLAIYLLRRKTVRFDLRGKHVVITGGSSGIGKCIAIEAAKRGSNITLIARDMDKLLSAKNEISKHCADKEQLIKCFSLDVCQGDDEFKKSFELIEGDLGPVDVLINNAGMAKCGKVEDMKMEDVKYLMDLNYFGTYRSIKAVIPSMKERKYGKIVIVGSQASLIGIFGFAAYCSSKFALRGLAEALHMEVLPYNISVTLALPPDTDTPGFANEEKEKPMETKLICQSAGLFKPEDVAKQIIDDTLEGKFFSTIGFESFLLTTLCAGMTPVVSFSRLMIEVMLIGPFRLISQFYLFQVHKIVKKCMTLKDDMKKEE